jgi:16S rRNA (guanine966-N2)-methyltransferase
VENKVNTKTSDSSSIRIISGRWRGKKIEFYPADGLRPTGDRLRETLFNWLQYDIEGAHCLDLFAGSGALGFEAASRGAELVVMVDLNAATVRQLQKQTASLETERIIIWQGSAEAYLDKFQHQFDLVFLDPPFDSELMAQTLKALERSNNVDEATRIYIEYPKQAEPVLPAGWSFERQKTTGDVGYGLLALS